MLVPVKKSIVVSSDSYSVTQIRSQLHEEDLSKVIIQLISIYKVHTHGL